MKKKKDPSVVSLPQDDNKKCMEKFVLVLPDIRSAHNVGAMFRTADGAGVKKYILSGAKSTGIFHRM